MISTVARKYAQALWRQWSSAEQAEAGWKALAALAEALRQLPLLGPFLKSPQVDRSAKQNLLAAALRSAPPEVSRFVDLLLQQGEIEQIQAVAEALRVVIDTAAGAEAVMVESATALTEAERRRLEKDIAQILHASLRVTYHVEDSLISGVRVRTRDRVLDGSAAGRLTALREALLAD